MSSLSAPLVVQWPLFHANSKLIGQGTMLRVSHEDCHVAGTMPVAAGMVLKVWISPTHRNEALYAKEARVLWARAHEFGLELRQTDAQDHQWLMKYLEDAEHPRRVRRIDEMICP
jgi:hypothetical protein